MAFSGSRQHIVEEPTAARSAGSPPEREPLESDNLHRGRLTPDATAAQASQRETGLPYQQVSRRGER
ncbi:unnamed protein product [Arctogadus glacialis]